MGSAPSRQVSARLAGWTGRPFSAPVEPLRRLDRGAFAGDQTDTGAGQGAVLTPPPSACDLRSKISGLSTGKRRRGHHPPLRPSRSPRPDTARGLTGSGPWHARGVPPGGVGTSTRWPVGRLNDSDIRARLRIAPASQQWVDQADDLAADESRCLRFEERMAFGGRGDRRTPQSGRSVHRSQSSPLRAGPGDIR